MQVWPLGQGVIVAGAGMAVPVVGVCVHRTFCAVVSYGQIWPVTLNVGK